MRLNQNTRLLTIIVRVSVKCTTNTKREHGESELYTRIDRVEYCKARSARLYEQLRSLCGIQSHCVVQHDRGAINVQCSSSGRGEVCDFDGRSVELCRRRDKSMLKA